MRFLLFTVLATIIFMVGMSIGTQNPDLPAKLGIDGVFREFLNNPEQTIAESADDIELPSTLTPAESTVASARPHAPTHWFDEIDARLEQGGYLRGVLSPDRNLTINDSDVPQTSSGAFYVGIGRDETGSYSLISAPDEPVSIDIANREFTEGQIIKTTRSPTLPPQDSVSGPMGDIDDLFEEPSRVVTRSGGTRSSLPDRKYREWVTKTEALNSRADTEGFLQNWISPIVGEWRETSSWGASRIKNGKVAVHAGLDMAAPDGTQLIAPAAGVITLASPDFYYEGGVVFIDHGLGFTSAYLHMSEVSVSEGEIIEQGAPIGRVGATGSASGPHLCWRLYAGGRDKAIDPINLVQRPDGRQNE